MSDRPLAAGRVVSIADSRSFAPCAWCGLLSETGPVCSICGSPVLDIAGWTTVLDVTWPIEPTLPPSQRQPAVSHQWVTLAQVADLFRIPELSLRSWLEEAPEAEEPRLLLIEPSAQKTPTAIWAPSDPVLSSLEISPPPALPDPPALVDETVMLEAEPSVPSRWVATMSAPQPFRLEAAWAFQPTETERRTIRMEMLRARGATILAIGIGATGIVYLIDHALR
jgi:hypothetical protein